MRRNPLNICILSQHLERPGERAVVGPPDRQYLVSQPTETSRCPRSLRCAGTMIGTEPMKDLPDEIVCGACDLYWQRLPNP